MERIIVRDKYVLQRKHVEPPLWKKWQKLAEREGLRRTTFFLNGDRYVGEWHNDVKHGVGTYWYKKNGEVYSGNWVKGRRSGYGTLSIPHPTIENENWKYYVGDWKNDKQHGYGICYFTNGDVFEGQWKYGKMCGWGRMIYHDGSIYEGDWQNGTRNGLGTFNSGNNYIYNGSWKNNLKDGSGELKLKDKGINIDGFWMEGCLRCGLVQDDKDKCLTPYHPLPLLELADIDEVLKNAKQDVILRYGTIFDNTKTDIIAPVETTLKEEEEIIIEKVEESLSEIFEECMFEIKESLVYQEDSKEDTTESDEIKSSDHSLSTSSDFSY
ncbi:MORN repeat-containing protein 3-like isoform X1 [Centruroides sculpturatus]|uniref:MORN repeat-containing protein 3-like isoform X1 n=1 Tax=Centruroides sculpturatus TaxID=218467 RepID=UPI000C6CAB87|nr:MORN repeat-containing protein 3-like isoform X1 [Centruroides sculpturatus]